MHSSPSGAAQRPRARPRLVLLSVALAMVFSAPSRPLFQREAAWAQPTGGTRAQIEEAYVANNRGVAFLEQYDYPAAAQAFRRALEISADIVAPRINLALALLYVPELAGARAAAVEAAQRAPESAHAHYVSGLIARAENQLDAAVAAFERVLQLDAEDVGARINLGQVRLQQRRHADAALLFEEALAREPFNATAAYNLATALTRGGRMEEGERAMARFATLREAPYARTYSNTYLEQGRYAEALRATGAEPELLEPAVAMRYEVRPLTDETLRQPSDQGRASGVMPGTVAVADLDDDGDLDVLAVRAERIERFDNNGRGRFTRNPHSTALQGSGGSGGVVGVLAADVDNADGPDVLVLGSSSVRLLLRKPDGGLGAASDLPSASGIWPRSAAMADFDHDGDLDILVGGDPVQPERGESPRGAGLSGLRAWRNNGAKGFEEISDEAGVALDGNVRAVVPTDFDDRRDLDVVVAVGNLGVRLLQNRRDGRFGDVAAERGMRGQALAAGTGDVNKDGYPDYVFVEEGGGTRFAMSRAAGRFEMTPGPAGPDGAGVALVFDSDNDGLLDVLLAGTSGMRLHRNLARRWEDVSASTLPEDWRKTSVDGAIVAVQAADFDGDATRDLLVRRASGAIELGLARGSTRRGVHVRLTGRVSNHGGLGAKVESRSGSLWSRAEYLVATPPPAASDLVFGLGSRSAVDALRIIWPSGILQAEIPPPAGRAPTTLAFTELDRKPSSCPFLFTWNGREFEFVTDFLGGGEMGYLLGPGLRNTPDPEEYIRVRDDQLVPRGEVLDLRITNELEEVVYLDGVRLLALTHPADTTVWPDEGLTAAPRKRDTFFLVRSVRPLHDAMDEKGHPVAQALAQIDGRFVDTFALERIRGYARPHSLTMRLERAANSNARQVLLLTGWTDYAFSSDNLAASQAGLPLRPPSLEMRQPDGSWRTVIDNVGIPIGRPQTIVLDITDHLPASGHAQFRLETSMRIYWDRIALADAQAVRYADAVSAAAPVALRSLSAVRAALRWRGFSREIAPGGRLPTFYQYGDVSAITRWKLMTGRYTREGDVRQLLRETDDLFVVARPGDEIALEFSASDLEPVPAGQRRTWFLHAAGYSKEMDPNSASPDEVLPLPFRKMSRYPYSWPETYPDSPVHRDYQERYNTRPVGRVLPPM